MQNRRDLIRSLPMLAILGHSVASPAQASSPGPNAELGRSGVFAIGSLAVKEGPTGTFQHVAAGKLPTGEQVEIHNTTLNPGQMPHPPHRHVHTEFMMIREGSLAWILGEVTYPVGAGDVLYARSNELHGLKNVGAAVARYTVIALGADAGL